MPNHQPLTANADTIDGLQRSPLLALPGEVRNRIYDLVFGTKVLCLYFEARDDIKVWRNHPSDRLSHGIYNLRQTCRQIARETEHYPFETLDASTSGIDKQTTIEINNRYPHLNQFEGGMKDRYRHVRHLIIGSQSMADTVEYCESSGTDFSPQLALPGRVVAYNGPIWPMEHRNLTTLTIQRPNQQTHKLLKKLLKALTTRFPKLVDLRYVFSWPNPQSRRYRIIGSSRCVDWYLGKRSKSGAKA